MSRRCCEHQPTFWKPSAISHHGGIWSAPAVSWAPVLAPQPKVTLTFEPAASTFPAFGLCASTLTPFEVAPANLLTLPTLQSRSFKAIPANERFWPQEPRAVLIPRDWGVKVAKSRVILHR